MKRKKTTGYFNRKKFQMELDRLRWTQSDLAREMDVSRQWIFQTVRKPTLKSIMKIADVFGIHYKDLLL